MIRDDNLDFYIFTGGKMFFMEQAGAVKCATTSCYPQIVNLKENA